MRVIISKPVNGNNRDRLFDNGRLRNVKDAQGTTLWLTVSENEYGQITSYSLGNQVIGELSYSDTTHLLRRQFAQKGIDNCPGFPLQLLGIFVS